MNIWKVAIPIFTLMILLIGISMSTVDDPDSVKLNETNAILSQVSEGKNKTVDYVNTMHGAYSDFQKSGNIDEYRDMGGNFSYELMEMWEQELQAEYPENLNEVKTTYMEVLRTGRNVIITLNFMGLYESQGDLKAYEEESAYLKQAFDEYNISLSELQMEMNNV